ncbi:MAG: winged helix-turn-helix transcriptional regulator, partial [Lachnospiraceae bacterium]
VVPPKTEYSLTDFGNTLAPILDAMCDWGTVYLDEVNISPTCCKSQK